MRIFKKITFYFLLIFIFASCGSLFNKNYCDNNYFPQDVTLNLYKIDFKDTELDEKIQAVIPVDKIDTSNYYLVAFDIVFKNRFGIVDSNNLNCNNIMGLEGDSMKEIKLTYRKERKNISVLLLSEDKFEYEDIHFYEVKPRGQRPNFFYNYLKINR